MSAKAALQCAEVLEWFSSFSGGTVPASRHGDLEARIRRVMRANSIPSMAYLKDALLAGHQVLDSIVSELTVAETYFFRDPHHFDLIRQRVIPEFLATHPADAAFQTWSAGCATGEEAYSLAILFDELGIGDRSRILATDICRASLQKAKRGRYGDWSFRSEASGAAKRYFRQSGAHFVLDEQIRGRVSFRYGNLAADPASIAAGTTGRDMNLILCRNVMIYFDPAAIRRLAGILFDALAPGGWLIVGPSDPPLWDFAPFEVVSTGNGLFYRRPPQTTPAVPRMANVPSAVLQAPPARNAAARFPTARLRGSRSQIPHPPSPATRAKKPDPSQGPEWISTQSSAREPAQEAESEAARTARLVREAADAGRQEFAAMAEAAAKAHPLDVEIQYLHALALLSARRFEAACATARRVVYLDGSLIMGHFILATALARSGQKEAARRSYRKAEALCVALPPDEKIRFANGETAAMLREAARLHLQAERTV